MMDYCDTVSTEGIVHYTVTTVASRDTHHDTDDTDHYNSVYTSNMKPADAVTVQVLNINGTVVSSGSTSTGRLLIDNVQLWWPHTMNDNRPAYLYTLQVEMLLVMFLYELNTDESHVTELCS